MLTNKIVATVICVSIAASVSFGQCKVCQEWQVGWLCVTTSSRVKCQVDGDTCIMNLSDRCASNASIEGCKPGLKKGFLRTASASAKGKLFFIVGNLDDPLALKEVAFKATGDSRSVKEGKLVNNAGIGVGSYQLAFVVVDRTTWQVSIVPGPVIDSTVPIKPGEQRGLVSIPIGEYVGKSDFAAVGVFVRQATFANGTVWHADVARIRADVEHAASEAPSVEPGKS